MSVFIATDGSKLSWETMPTLAAVVELFNLVYEEQINAGHIVLIDEGREGTTTGAMPLSAAEVDAAAGSDTQGGAGYEYRD